MAQINEFELDFGRYELRRDGRRVGLAKQPMELLILLVRKRGLLVTREEIVKLFWGDEPIGEIDASINNAIRMIRRAFKDAPDKSRFVETIPGKGYRFIGPITVMEERPRIPIRENSRIPTAKERPRSLPKLWWLIALMLLAMLGIALTLALYGLAILAFCLIAVFVVLGYPFVTDTPYTRAIVAIFMLAAMSFIPSAWTLPHVMARVVNITTLKPALVYPFVTGSRFIPLLVLIFAYWVGLSLHGDTGFLREPSWRKTYIFLGIVFLLLACIATACYYDDYRIWQTKLPGRWTIFICDMSIFGVNLTLWLLAYSFLRKDFIFDYRNLFVKCGTAYLLIALPAVLIDREYNEINSHYLDKRRADAYVVTNPDAIRNFRNPVDKNLRIKVGQDLLSLLNSSEFDQVVRGNRFYKQDFDEPFQVFNHAVMFGYKRPQSPQQKPIFVIIRFPEDLANALRFQLIGEER